MQSERQDPERERDAALARANAEFSEAVAEAAGNTEETITIDLSKIVSVGSVVPIQGLWFRVAKCEGPYVMLRAIGVTSKMRRSLRG
jgi:hypothetical protein